MRQYTNHLNRHRHGVKFVPSHYNGWWCDNFRGTPMPEGRGVVRINRSLVAAGD